MALVVPLAVSFVVRVEALMVAVTLATSCSNLMQVELEQIFVVVEHDHWNKS